MTRSILPLALALLGAVACTGGDGEQDGGGGTGGSGGTGGGGTIPLDCREVLRLEPCAGNPIGTWELVLACSPLEHAITVEESIPACRDLPITAFALEAAGEIAVSGAEWTDTTAVDLSLGFAIPDACLDAAGGGAGRDVVCQTAGVEPGNRFPGFHGFCAFDTGGCRCGLDVSYSWPGTGPYGIWGPEILAGSDAGPRILPYCVRDNRLVLRAEAGLVLVLQRQ